MNWTIPGTILTARREEAVNIEKQFESMFLGGGIVLSQVSRITGLEPYTVQNWVKRGFLPSPEHKRYNMNQLCRIILINMLKSVLPMEKITGLISYVNGQLDNTADDIIDDAKMYFLFVRLAAQVRELKSPEEFEKSIQKQLSTYQEPVPGAKQRVAAVLRIMLTAWSAAALQKRAEDMLQSL